MEHWLKILRKRHGYSQTELGKLLDSSKGNIHGIERGRYDPSVPLAIRISRLFNISLADILGKTAISPLRAGRRRRAAKKPPENP